MEEQLFIGVDGGGTKTEAVLAVSQVGHPFPVILASCVSGPGNLQRLPADAAYSEVEKAVQGLFDAIPSVQHQVVAACFSMAGTGNKERTQAFRRWLSTKSWGRCPTITHDARPLVSAGTMHDVGVAIIAGTGSFAYARTEDGREVRCGGWGGLLGDEGSAYWLVIQALIRCLHSLDGRGHETRLLPAMEQWLGGVSATDWPLHLSSLPRDSVAAGSTVVAEIAMQGDAVAQQILQEAAHHLARQVEVLVDQLFPSREIELALAGGLICGCELLLEQLLQNISGKQICVTRYAKVEHPSHGAARLAIQAFRDAAR